MTTFMEHTDRGEWTPPEAPEPVEPPFFATVGKTSARLAGTAAVSGLRRLGRGLRAAPGDVLAWLQATEYDEAVAIAKEAKDAAKTIIATDRRDAVTRARKAVLIWTVFILLSVAGGGWTPITVGLGVASLALVAAGHLGAVRWAMVLAPVSAFLDSLTIEMVRAVQDWPVWPWPVGVLALVLALLTWAAGDGSVTDNLPAADLAPAAGETGPVTDGTLAKHVNDATPGLDNNDAAKAARVVEPGIVWVSGGRVWKAQIDTGGVVPAAAILAPKVRTALAAKMRVGESNLQMVVDRSNAALLELTGIVGDPWGPGTRSPLVDVERVDLWRPVAFGRDITGADVFLDVPFNNFFFGGMPDAGKSTSLTNLAAAFFKSPRSKVRVIDGGEVDTEPYHRAGLTHRWCREPEEAIEVLKDFNADINATQTALAECGKKKVDAEFFAETGTDFDLLLWDEVEAYLNHPEAKIRNELRRLANDAVSRSRKTGKVILCATQSMDADSLDSAFRDKFMIRLAHYCRTRDMSDKILGGGAAARGLDASLLDMTVPGLGWLSLRTGTDLARPHFLTDDDVDTVIRQAKALRRLVGLGPPVPDVLPVMAAIIRSQGTAMNSTDLLERLRRDERFAELDAVTLADLVRPNEVRTVKTNGTKHYLLADVERALAQAS